MGLWRWLGQRMEADDGHEPRADDIVTVATVNLAISGVVLAELRQAGIRAEVVEQRPGYYGIAQGRIMCFAPDQAAAAEIVDRIVVNTAP